MKKTIALVTGGGSGIGKATAMRLGAEGACVIIADRDLTSAQSVATELGGPDKAIAVAVDVTDEAQVSAAIDAGVIGNDGDAPNVAVPTEKFALPNDTA